MPAVTVEDDALVGALVAFKALPKDIQKDVAKATRSTLTPLFKKVYQQRAAEGAGRSGGGSSRQDYRMAGRGSIRVTSGGKGSLAGYTGSRALSGGMVPNTQYPFTEFGSKGAYARQGRLPWFRKGGRIMYPTVKSWAPTAASVWLAVIADAVRNTGVAEDA